MQKVRLGIVGLGRMGTYHAEDIAFRMKDADLTAICCRNEDRARKMQEEFGTRYAFSSYEQLLKCKEVDAVVICSASDKHCAQVIKALEACRHVFCEKPLGLTVKECMAVEKAARAHRGLVVQTGFMTRYDKAYVQARKMIADGKIGKPIYFRSYRMDAVRYIQSSIAFADRSGGLFFDVAVHDFDLAIWILDDEPVSVYALGGCYRYEEFARTSDCDNGIVTLVFKSGAMGTVFSGRTCPHGFHVETEIIGTHGTIHIGPRNEQTEVYYYSESGVNQKFEGWFSDRFRDAFLNEKKAFVQCILNGTDSEVTMRDAAAATKISEAAWESYRRKRPQKIPDDEKTEDTDI